MRTKLMIVFCTLNIKLMLHIKELWVFGQVSRTFTLEIRPLTENQERTIKKCVNITN